MSLRDQLIAKGLASKKDGRRVDRELKHERKSKQSQRRKKSVVEREAVEAAKDAREELLAHKRAEREAIERIRAAEARKQRIRSLVHGNRLRAHGRVAFYHRARDGRRVRRLEVPEQVAWRLRCGELAIAAVPEDDDDYAIVSARAAEGLVEVAPELVVFWVRDTTGISEPDHAFTERTEPILGAHRATETDVERLR